MMTRNSLLTLLSLLLLIALSAPLISKVSQEPEHGVEEPTPEHVEKESPLAENMEIIKKVMRKLRRGLSDEEQLPAALPLVVDMQAAAQLCKTELPVMAESIADEDERADFVKRYRLGMIQFQSGLLKLEEAVLNGDSVGAQRVLRTLKNAQEKAHEEFTDE
jgi:hypothetical protein